MMVTARKVAVPVMMLKMVRRVYAVAALENRKLSRYIKGITAQPYRSSKSSTSTKWFCSKKAFTPNAPKTTYRTVEEKR